MSEVVVAEANTYIEFGRSLQAQREEKGLSLESVGKVTKISPTLIEALEAGHVERFPERVFVLNYLRSYAIAVGLSSDDVVRRYQQIPGVPLAEKFDPAGLEVVRRSRAYTTLWLVVAAISIGTLGFAFNVMTELAVKYTHR